MTNDTKLFNGTEHREDLRDLQRLCNIKRSVQRGQQTRSGTHCT